MKRGESQNSLPAWTLEEKHNWNIINLTKGQFWRLFKKETN